MDPVCHTLAGAALGESGLKRRTALGMPTLLFAANAPDIDVLVYATDALHVHVRRGWTHGPIALLVLPLLLVGLMLAWDRLVRQRRTNPPAPVSPRGLVLLAYIGTLSHPFLDYLNSYGIRLLMPFSERWFYGDALYIVDPWMYLMLGGAVLTARIAARLGTARPERLARAGLGLAAVYITLMLVSNQVARSAVRAGMARAGLPPDTRFMVTPVPVNPFAREVLIDTGDRYEKGFLWFEPGPHFRPAGYGITTNRAHPVAKAAAATVRGRQYLGWSRFPFFVVEQTGSEPVVHVNDARYAGEGQDGWARETIPVKKGTDPF